MKRESLSVGVGESGGVDKYWGDSGGVGI